MADNRATQAFLDDVDASLRTALTELVVPAELPATTPPPDWGQGLLRLESNLSGWQSLLAEMASKVQETQSELALLDADLKRSLDAFAVARKHLQGAAHLDG